MLSRQTSGCDVTLVRTFRIQPRPSSTMVDLPAPPSFRLDGRRALVTGAGRGIGLAAAATLAQAGAQTTLCARTVSELEDRKSTRLNSSHKCAPRMPSSA